MKYLLSISFIFLLSCSATKKQADAKEPAATKLNGTSWTLSSFPGMTMEKLKNVSTLHFADTGGAMNGFSGCNGFGGTFIANGRSLKMGQILGTLKACMPGMKTESTLYKALNNTDHYKISGGKLILLQGDKTLAEFTEMKKE